MKIISFTDLEVWKNSINVVKQIYLFSSLKEFSKDFSLRDQIRRASISISSNIAEGFERNNNNEFIYFLKIAKGSTGEVRTQLFLALEVGYIAKEHYDDIDKELMLLSQQIGKFISYLETKRKLGQFKRVNS